ncbi:unnamed protein product [Caenorhabditis bovis]|uniref:Uncharacterized protein n=1 Tax=Caenorhabditis bovis TaxID=2654633 RepID=A0A8S1FDB7_9PELO|nr:unnamed protein product [Caenorhabditis bovis]
MRIIIAVAVLLSVVHESTQNIFTFKGQLICNYQEYFEAELQIFEIDEIFDDILTSKKKFFGRKALNFSIDAVEEDDGFADGHFEFAIYNRHNCTKNGEYVLSKYHLPEILIRNAGPGFLIVKIRIGPYTEPVNVKAYCYYLLENGEKLDNVC